MTPEQIYDFSKYVRKEERDRILALLDSEHSEFTTQHQADKKAYVDDCFACLAIELIRVAK
jgi:hypothetical protein